MYKIDNKYQKAKIKNLEQRLDFKKYNIKKKKKKKKKSHKNIKKQQQQSSKNIYGVCFKNRVCFFCLFFRKVRVGYKNKN